MTILAQEFLQTHSLAELKAQHGVNFRIHDHKFSLNYDMLEASNSDPVASQCRGVVLMPWPARTDFDENTIIGETRILARTMDRFFNHGQQEAANIDFECHQTVFYEKLDGTMAALYYDQHTKNWCVATRSVPEADLPVDGHGTFTFRTLFEKAVREVTGMHFDIWIENENLFQDMTYVFELCTPVNRVVVDHDDYKLFSIAIRHSCGAEERIEDPSYGLKYIPKCHSYKLSSLTDMIEFVSSRNPLKHEGIVAMDNKFRRVKVKNPSYLALSRAKDSAMRSPRALLELCLAGKLDDALPLLPDHVKDRAYEIQKGLTAFIRYSDTVYQQVCVDAMKLIGQNPNWPQRKAMAIAATNNDAWMAFIMLRYAGKIKSFHDFINSHIDAQTGEYKRGFLDALLKHLE